MLREGCGGINVHGYIGRINLIFYIMRVRVRVRVRVRNVRVRVLYELDL